MGWLPAPKISRPWVIGAAVFVIASAPAANWPFALNFEFLRWVREVVWVFQEKTDFGLLRYAHFLALAYLAIAIVNPRLHLLRSAWAKPVVTVGQNSLAVFLLSMGLSQVAGMALDQIGRTPLTFALVNIAGLAFIVGFAYWCTMLKKQPWRKLAAEYDASRGHVRQARESDRMTSAPSTSYPAAAE